MIKEDVHEIMTQLELRREISKLKYEIKKRDKLIQRLEEKVKKLERNRRLNMELWIRSQDKIKLIKVNYCYIRDWQDHFAIEGETFDSAPIIGEYKTKERALEVLDEIQNILETRNDVNQMVYEMPQD